jgi:putative DNA primase/helicase
MRSAATVVTWHLFEARRFLGQLATPPEIANAKQLEVWLMDQCRRENITEMPFNRIQKYGPNRMRAKKLLDAAVDVLEGAGRIRRQKRGRKNILQINPAVLRED